MRPATLVLTEVFGRGKSNAIAKKTGKLPLTTGLLAGK
jgi:hypothetical protein